MYCYCVVCTTLSFILHNTSTFFSILGDRIGGVGSQGMYFNYYTVITSFLPLMREPSMLITLGEKALQIKINTLSLQLNNNLSPEYCCLVTNMVEESSVQLPCSLKDIRKLKQRGRQHQGQCLVKNEYFSFKFCNYLDLYSLHIGLKTCSN